MARHLRHHEVVQRSSCRGYPPLKLVDDTMQEGGENTEFRDLACQGTTFFCLIGLDVNIADASHLLFPLLVSKVPPHDEALEWIRFAYTVGRLGAYVDPGSTEMDFSTLLEA